MGPRPGDVCVGGWGLLNAEFIEQHQEALKLPQHSESCCSLNCVFTEASCPLHKPCLAADQGWEKTLEKGLQVRWRLLSSVPRGGSTVIPSWAVMG